MIRELLCLCIQRISHITELRELRKRLKHIGHFSPAERAFALASHSCPHEPFHQYSLFEPYSEEGFKYYHFVNAESAEAFDEFIAKCKELALYDTDVSAEYGDQLITLSTCEYSRTNGRMVVVAKLLE